MKPRSLRYRLIRLSWIMVGGLLAASYLSIFLLLRSTALRQVDQDLMAAAEPVVENLATDRTMHDVRDLGGGGRFFEVFAAGGRVRERSKNLSGDLPVPAAVLRSLPASAWFADVQGPAGPMRLAVIPFVRHGHSYLLATGIATFGSMHVLDSFGEIILVLLPVSLLLAGLISAWYVDKGLAPVRALTSHVEQMAALALQGGQPSLWRPLEVATPTAEMGRLTLRFHRLFERVAAVVRQVRRFVTDASHEIRTPLTILRGEIELLVAGGRPPADFDRTVQALDQELRHLTRIVDGLFTLSMADAGQLRLLREPLYLNELLEDACRLVSPRAQAKRIRLERDLGADVAFRGDEAFLHELFLILLDNAIKYSPPDSRITVSLAAERGRVVMRCQDQGCGVPAAELDHIFERFYRASGSLAEPGSGLGLAIAQAIVAVHGGAIACESAVGVGSTFTIALPRPPAPEGAPAPGAGAGGK